MVKMDEKPIVIGKRKNIQILLDYCLDQRFTINVKPRGLSSDDFEVEISLDGIKQAIALGMFIKENKFDVSGMGELLKPKAATFKKNEPKENGTTGFVISTPEPAKVDGSLLSLDLNVKGS